MGMTKKIELQNTKYLQVYGNIGTLAHCSQGYKLI